jgi:uncharacterized protein (DUF1800 family)
VIRSEGAAVNKLTRVIFAAVAFATASALALPSWAQSAPTVAGTLSRKIHGAAGTFDLPLAADPLNPSVEPRNGPTHTIVFTFSKPVASGAAAVSEGVATAGTPTFAGTEMRVPLTGVTNAQYVTVAVTNVVATDGGSGGSGSIRFGLLAGDVNQSRVVTLSDLGQVNSQLSQSVTAANFLRDVNASGTITLADKAGTNAYLTSYLPAPVNSPPVANAGAAQSVTAGVQVYLDGSASFDPNIDPLTYGWTLTSKPAGSSAALSGSNTVSPSFVADVAGAYVVSLVVNDGVANSAASTVNVTATPLLASDQRKDAARFMRQATFGATRDSIDQLVAQGTSAWLNAQFAMPIVSHVTTVLADPNLPESPWAVTMPSLWKQYFEGDDQLRQRVGYALSQIFVVSLNNNAVQDASCGAAGYLDILNRNAFGNARTLLRDITLNPIMGEYLSMKESAKGDPVLQTQPDENYAREVMQLFSIGTVMLNIDGSVQLNGNGVPIPTYNEDTVKGFAQALSGWTYAGQDQSKSWRWLYPDIWDADPVIKTGKACPAWTNPMEPWITDYRSADDARTLTGPAHDTGTKQLLVYPGAPYSTLPAGQAPMTDLDNVIDNIFNHPNLGPFLAKRLIQRLVTSNPSPQYIRRVALKFNNNGSGVRGDMKAVITAILLDNEARNLTVAGGPTYGKLTEPVVRFVQMHRAFNAKRGNGYYDLWDFGAPSALNQSPLHAGSVFNFYHPDYTPAGPLQSTGLVGPEFEITYASSVAGFSDFSKWGIINGFDHYNSDTTRAILPDYSYYLGLTGTPQALIDELDIVLCAGGLNAAVKAQIVTSVGKVSASSGALERLNMALWLIINSPDYSVQK